MRRPPRDPDERLFSPRHVGLSALQGASALVVCVTIFVLFRRDHGTDAARSLTFLALVVSFLAIIITNRSWSRNLLGLFRIPNSAQWWVMAMTTILLVAALLAPPVRRLFHFAPLHAPDVVIATIAGIVCVTWLEAVKAVHRRRLASSGRTGIAG